MKGRTMLMPLLENEDWKLDAKCRGADTTLFFPERGKNTVKKIRQQFCDRCPVAATCADYAVRHKIHHGVWGSTEKERRRRRGDASQNVILIAKRAERERLVREARAMKESGMAHTAVAALLDVHPRQLWRMLAEQP